MRHPDNGLMQALLDGELEGVEAEELRVHFDGCVDCSEGFQALEAASVNTRRALQLLDTPPRLVAARSRFRARPRGRNHRFLGLPITLPRAASIALLLTGAAATALPGSPARRWLVGGWNALTHGSGTATFPDALQGPAPAPTPVSPQGAWPETGAGIPALSEGVEVWIHGLSGQAELRVVWTESDEVWIFAGEGTRFNRDSGRLEAYSPPGGVRVEIPRTLQRIVVGLEGSVLLRKSGEDLEILGPVLRRTPSEIVFETPGPSNDGSR